jgi:hypothetical protein
MPHGNVIQPGMRGTEICGTGRHSTVGRLICLATAGPWNLWLPNRVFAAMARLVGPQSFVDP